MYINYGKKDGAKLPNIDVVETATSIREIISVRENQIPILHRPAQGPSVKIGFMEKKFLI